MTEENVLSDVDLLQNCEEMKKGKQHIARNLDGLPVPSLTTSYTLGPRGPVLMQDDNAIQTLKIFARGNAIPRFVRAKGIGAYGTFQVTNDISNLTAAKLFSQVGKKTEFFCRFSSSNEPGSPDGSTNPTTVAFKLYTEDGNFDILTLPIPVFLYSDPMYQASFIRSSGRNPQTNFHDGNTKWDFILHVPQSVHAVMHMYADIPKTFRNADLFAINVFKLVNSNGHFVYCKWTLESNEGMVSATTEQIKKFQAMDPDFQIRDLFNAIEKGHGPSWTLNVQTMTQHQVDNFMDKKTGTKWNAFDLTKNWPREDYPLQKVGIFKVKRNVHNHFNETEQAVFNAGRLVPGIEIPIQDALLQGRSFAYQAAHAYRLGINADLLPVNYPKGIKEKLYTYSREGSMNGDVVNGGAPHYYPNSFGGPTVKPVQVKSPQQKVSGKICRRTAKPVNMFSQPKKLWESFGSEKKKMLVKNIIQSASPVDDLIKKGIIALFSHVSKEFGEMLENGFKNT